jgi:hypothetical protein
VLDEGESYKTEKSDKQRFVIVCKDDNCKFRIRAAVSEKEVVSITVFKPHSCSPAIYYKSWQSQSTKYLMNHHCAAVIDNRNITAKQIQSNERLQYNNTISYQQAYRTIRAIIQEIDGDEAECFSKIPAYLQRYVEADQDNFAQTQQGEEDSENPGAFQAIFMAPAGTKHAFEHLRPFIRLDGAITKFKFRMQLLTICGIDASDEVLPVAWGLVPIENTKWWTWVLEGFRGCFPNANWEDYVFISDREKGIPASLTTIFPEAFQAHCCQHIADNVAAKYGNKCKPLFWVCARAKTKQAFQNALQELRRHKVAAADYINAIPHET